MQRLFDGDGPVVSSCTLSRDDLSWDIQIARVSTHGMVGDEESVRCWLNSAEHAQQFVPMSDRRRTSYLLGRTAAKTALVSAISNASPSDIQIDYGALGEPLVAPPHSHLGISIAHTEDQAVAVAYPQALICGIDLESVRPGAEKAIESQLNEQDLRCLRSLTLDNSHALTLAWTIKEAVAKALRVGMSAPFSVLTIKSIESLSQSHWMAQMQVPGSLVVFIWRERNHYLSLCVPERISRSDSSLPQD